MFDPMVCRRNLSLPASVYYFGIGLVSVKEQCFILQRNMDENFVSQDSHVRQIRVWTLARDV